LGALLPLSLRAQSIHGGKIGAWLLPAAGGSDAAH
jgi:hypothetical protein